MSMPGQWGAIGGCGERAALKGLLTRAEREELSLSRGFPNSGQSPCFPQLSCSLVGGQAQEGLLPPQVRDLKTIL